MDKFSTRGTDLFSMEKTITNQVGLFNVKYISLFGQNKSQKEQCQMFKERSRSLKC